MDHFSDIFTVFFMLLGPVKIIPIFAGLTRGADDRFKRNVAIWGTVIASALCAFVALAGGTLLSRFHISIDALRISGGLVLLIAALQLIFGKGQSSSSNSGTSTAIQLAASSVAVPIIVPPAGIAAILIFMMLGMVQPVVISLIAVMVLNLLVMVFIERIMKTPGLMTVLTVLGSVLLFVQLSLSIQIILNALKNLGAFKV